MPCLEVRDDGGSSCTVDPIGTENGNGRFGGFTPNFLFTFQGPLIAYCKCRFNEIHQKRFLASRCCGNVNDSLIPVAVEEKKRSLT